MIKLSTLKILLFAVVTVMMLAACQSEPSAGIVETVTVESTAADVEPPAAEPTVIPEPTAMPEAAATATREPTIEPTEAPTAVPTETPPPAVEPGIIRTYEIVSDKSEVRFKIDEVLFGNPKTVVGRTNQVTGKIGLDLQDPQGAEVGPIQINARELATDESFRNRALRRQILDSAQDEYQFITFTPTQIEGLSGGAAVGGEAYTFSLTGDLQIRDIVQPVTFEMTVTAVSETELTGTGAAVVLRSDYDLRIPSVTGVADVSEEVRLEIDFVAQAEG